MPNNLLRARELLDTWRTQHAGRPLPIGLQVIDALARRTNNQADQTRTLLDARLGTLLDAQKGAVSPSKKHKQPGKRTQGEPANTAPSGLSGLLHHLAGHALTKLTPVAATAQLNPFPELPALDEFRQTWAKVRTDSQLRQSLVQSSEHAGPLNSGVLVNRAIHLMRDLSPGYLQHFVAYVDVLSWMEQMQNNGILATRQAQHTAVAKKPIRKPSRKR